jgi:glycosyltransferase involved in cell wall biosynthesis
MKILFIATNIPTVKRKSNGVILRIAEYLSKNHEVDVIFPKEIIPFWLRNKFKFKSLYNLKDYVLGSKKVEVLSYIRLPYKSYAFLGLKYLNLSRFGHKNYDVIHAHFLFPDGLIAQRISQQFNRPYVVSIRYSDVALIDVVSYNSSTYQLAKSCLENANAIHVLNEYTGQWINEKFQVNYTVIPHGVNLPESLSLSHQHEKITISCVAEFIPLKQIDWVINAVKSYEGSIDLELKIVGKGPLQEELYALRADDSRIHFIGHVSHDEVMKILTESNIFVMPSTKETFGLVYLEAAATHNAIIAYHKYSINGVFESEKEALFCKGYINFKNQLHRLIDDPVEVKKLADSAMEKVQKMSWGSIIQEYNQLYESIT